MDSASTIQTTGAAAGPSDRTLFRRNVLILAIVGVGVFVAALDQTVVVTALPAIFNDIGLPVTRLDEGAWIVTGYLIGYTAAMPLMGRVSDVYGHGRVYVLSLFVFMFGSALVALGGSLGWIVGARVIQAVGGGAVVPVAIAIAHGSLPKSKQGIAVGVIVGVAEAGSVLGPLYGGLVLRFLDWRWLFWLNLPLGGLIAILVLALVGSRRHAAATVDYLGGILLGGSLACLALGLSGLPGLGAGVPRHAMILMAALALLAGFVFRQARAASPLVPLRIFGRIPIAAANGASFLVGGGLILALVDIPLMSDTIMGQSALEGGLRLLRLTAMIPVGALAGGLLYQRWGYRAPVVLGACLAALGFFFMSRWPLVIGEPRLTLELMVGGLGFGFMIVPVVVAVLDNVRPGQQATASALVTVTRMIGMIVGLSALSSWGQQRFTYLVNRIPSPLFDPQVTERQRALYEAQVADAALRFFHEVFVVGTVVCILAIGPALLLGKKPRKGGGVR